MRWYAVACVQRRSSRRWSHVIGAGQYGCCILFGDIPLLLQHPLTGRNAVQIPTSVFFAVLRDRGHGYRYFRIHFFSPISCGVYDDVKVRSPWFWSSCASRVRSSSWMTSVEESTVAGGGQQRAYFLLGLLRTCVRFAIGPQVLYQQLHFHKRLCGHWYSCIQFWFCRPVACGAYDYVKGTASPPDHLSYPSSTFVTCNTGHTKGDLHGPST